jgi:hypothetical protein
MANGINVSMVLTVPVLDEQTAQSFYRSTIKDMVNELGIAERLFNRQTATWSSKSQPIWERELPKFTGNEIVASVLTKSKPFIWVNNPRRPGKATFSTDYKPKTKPRKAGSGPGAGKVLRRGREGKKIKKVTPREIYLRVEELRQDKYVKRASKEVIRDFNRYFRSTKRSRIKVIRVI